MITYREHQQDCYDKVTTAIRTSLGIVNGRVVIPTGGGKTLVQAGIVKFQIENYQDNCIHLIVAPRIMLVNQLVDEYRKLYYGTGSAKGYSEIAFHSGDDPGIDEWAIGEMPCEATTNPQVVKDELIASMQYGGKHLVVFSTYHSCGKLADFGFRFDTMIADESQYCVSQNFHENIKRIDANVKLFFTATEKHTKGFSGRGLNNVSVYGNRMYEIEPYVLVERGLIVPPRLHIMHYSVAENDSDDSIMDTVIELVKEQDKLTRESLHFSKILVAMKGTGDVNYMRLYHDKIKKRLPEHDVFTIFSDQRNEYDGGVHINNQSYKREQFIEELKVVDRNCIIFHYDILSEGIDIDGITGVIILRNMDDTKLQQTIGRSIRLYKPNPLLKKQAWISVAVVNGNDDDKENVKRIVTGIRRGGFDLTHHDVVETDNTRHKKDEDETLESNYKDEVSHRFYSLFIENIFHEIEEQEFMDDIEGIDSFEDVQYNMFEQLFISKKNDDEKSTDELIFDFFHS